MGRQNGHGTDAADSSANTRWEGYSDYQAVSHRVGQSIESAVEAYAEISSAHTEGAPVTPDQAAEARAAILAAALKLVPEMENDREAVTMYDEILDRWNGEEGFIARLNDMQLQQTAPGWLFQFIVDIRRAGWELGYLQAGRTAKSDPDDPVEAEASSMFEE